MGWFVDFAVAFVAELEGGHVAAEEELSGAGGVAAVGALHVRVDA